jgi:putative membrane protein
MTTTLLFGATAGAMGTMAMSALLAAARLPGLMGPLPPRRVTKRIAERSGADRALSGPAFEASWAAAHVGYGAACGALYALARRAFPASPVSAGLVFGGLVWGGSYLGLLPALGIYGGPEEEEPATTATMIAAHAVYGVATALAEERIREPEAVFA